jgi:hypothetical protein
MEECEFCDGTGTCPDCEIGDECNVCGGSNECPECGGTGEE